MATTTTTTYKKIVDNVIDRLNNPLAGRKTKNIFTNERRKKKFQTATEKMR
jgi:hypothetical protein